MVIQHLLTNAKDGVIPLSGLKKLPFMQAYKDKHCPLNGVDLVNG